MRTIVMVNNVLVPEAPVRLMCLGRCIPDSALCSCVDSWLGGDGSEGMEDAEDMLCNTLLITGPTGVGKTAAVYACAQELGFKVRVLRV